jgi:hypothetical protein
MAAAIFIAGMIQRDPQCLRMRPDKNLTSIANLYKIYQGEQKANT